MVGQVIPRGIWLLKWLLVFRNPVFAGVLGVDRLPPKQKATGSSPVGGMAGNPFICRGFRPFYLLKLSLDFGAK